MDSLKYLKNLAQDEIEWDLAPLLRGLHDNLSDPEYSDDYYKILIEFAKLPRSAWREVKRRFALCVEKSTKDEFSRPYRMTYPESGCGFVFIPVISDVSGRADWKVSRSRGLQQLTLAHKYDQRLSKSVGVIVAKIEDFFEIHRCFIEEDWVADAEMQKALDENFPFREVKDRTIYGYKLQSDD